MNVRVAWLVHLHKSGFSRTQALCKCSCIYAFITNITQHSSCYCTWSCSTRRAKFGMAAVRPVLYREVLTPSLHRRFTDCSLLVFAFCYIESILLAEKTSCELHAFCRSSRLYSLNLSFMDLVSCGSSWHSSVAALHIRSFDLCPQGRFFTSWSVPLLLRAIEILMIIRKPESNLTLNYTPRCCLPVEHIPHLCLVPLFSMVV